MTRVILDFPEPGSSAPGRRLLFRDPRRVVAAASCADVLPCLREVEAEVAAGRWAAGLVAYEAAPAFDRALATLPAAGPVPLLWFAIFDEPADADLPVQGAVPAPPLFAAPGWITRTSRSAYDEAIRAIREGIAAGDFYQVNHTLRFHTSFSGDARDLYDAFTRPRHGLYHALLETDDWAVVSASPELFLERVGRRITTRPMKGTMRRGRWLEEDHAMARRLAESAKDRAENLMIVDLLRNDLGRVADWGSVAVPRLFETESFPTVHQMTSTVTATLRDDVSLCDVLTAMFPCGSVTGAPKIAAMQAIARLEDAPRGPYCGTVGIVRPDGSATFNVAIRTVTLDRRTGAAVYGAGGGITWDSVADAEYDEVVAKASLLEQPLPSFDLLETMRMDDGVIQRLDLHLQRLHESATFFGFAEGTADNAARRLGELRDRLAAGSWRLRLTADRAGKVSVAHASLHQRPLSLRDAAATPLPVAVAQDAVHDRDVRLFHKTTARSLYDDRRAAHPDMFDVLLVNQRGELTEFCLGNVVLEIDGRLLTPDRGCGLLAGTMRRQLLDAGTISEAVIGADQLPRASRLWHVNSVRGCTPVVLAHHRWPAAQGDPVGRAGDEEKGRAR